LLSRWTGFKRNRQSQPGCSTERESGRASRRSPPNLTPHPTLGAVSRRRRQGKSYLPQALAQATGGVRAVASGSGDGAKARAAGVQQQKGIYVYRILPADIEVAAGMPGVGEHPGPLRAVRSDGLAALISEVDLSGPPGSPEDLRTHREILDDTAVEVPVLPLRFGTILASEDAVARELLVAHHDEFTAALDQLEGRAEFQVKGRYIKDAVLAEVSSEDKHAATAAGSRAPPTARWHQARLTLPTTGARGMLTPVIDPDSAVPPYEQVAKMLRDEIAQGTMTGRIPSVHTIAEHHRVSHRVAARALEILQGEGMIENVPGEGHVVRHPRT
jgi:Gas vesicle synthesis protein GvpL/GvpF/Bacterial regulatory proteins, gntR family